MRDATVAGIDCRSKAAVRASSGTTSRSAQQFAREVDALGGNLDAFTGKEAVCFSIKVLDENVPAARKANIASFACKLKQISSLEFVAK